MGFTDFVKRNPQLTAIAIIILTLIIAAILFAPRCLIWINGTCGAFYR